MPRNINEITKEIKELGLEAFEDPNFIEDICSLTIEEILELQNTSVIARDLGEIWINQNNRSVDDLNAILSGNHSRYKANVFVRYQDRDYADEVPNPKAHLYKPYHISSIWLGKNNSKENFKSAITLNYLDEDEKAFLFLEFIKLSQGDYQSAREILDLHESLNIKKSYALQSVNSWLNLSENNIIDEFTFSKLILQESKDPNENISLAKKWLSKAENNFGKETFLKLLEIKYHSSSLEELSDLWFEKNNLSHEEFKNLYTSANDEAQNNLAKFWNNFAFEDFEKVFEIFGNDQTKKTLSAISWFEKNGSNLEFEKLESVVKAIKGDLHSDEKKNLAKIWLGSNANYENFIKLSKSELVFSPYDTEKIAELFANNQANFDEKNFVDACKDLYPTNESLQVDLFAEILKRVSINDQSTDQIKKNAFDLIQSLNVDNEALEALKNLKLKITVTEQETLEIASKRLDSKYKSIKNLLENKSLSDSITEEGSKLLKETFGDYSFSGETNNLATIFSYYDINQNLAAFNSIVKSEVLLEIGNSFSPSSDSAYISPNDLNKIYKTFNNQSNLILPKTKTITDYLESTVATKLKEAKEYQPQKDYEFAASNLLNENIQKYKLTESFKNLFKNNQPSNEDICDFFEKLINPEPEITNENKLLTNQSEISKLGDFFRAQKNTLAFLFTQKSGIDNFCVVISTLGRGCVGHIGTQANSALYQSLFQSCKNLNASILFNTFQEQFVEPILGNASVDRIANNPNGEDLFKHQDIVNSFISPNGLLAGIAKQFYNNQVIRMDADNFIDKQIGGKAADDLKQSVYDEVEKNNPEDTIEEIGKKYNSEISKLAAYIVLKKTIPEICTDKHLTEKPIFFEKIDPIGLISETAPSATPSFFSCLPFLQRTKRVSPVETTSKTPSFLDRFFNRNSTINPER